MTDLYHSWLGYGALSIIGTVAFAFSGYLVGVRKHLDALGIIIVALLTAIGGGVIRDILLNRIPVVFFEYTNVIIIAITVALAWLTGLHKKENQAFGRLFLVADSLGLVAFSMTGAQLAIDYGLNGFGVILIGFVTAVGGGVVRDMMVNDIPFILHKDFYGTVSILVAAALFVMNYMAWVTTVLIHIVFVAGVLLRLLAHRHELDLPKIRMAKH